MRALAVFAILLCALDLAASNSGTPVHAHHNDPDPHFEAAHAEHQREIEWQHHREAQDRAARLTAEREREHEQGRLRAVCARRQFAVRFGVLSACYMLGMLGIGAYDAAQTQVYADRMNTVGTQHRHNAVRLQHLLQAERAKGVGGRHPVGRAALERWVGGHLERSKGLRKRLRLAEEEVSARAGALTDLPLHKRRMWESFVEARRHDLSEDDRLRSIHGAMTRDDAQRQYESQQAARRAQEHRWDGKQVGVPVPEKKPGKQSEL